MPEQDTAPQPQTGGSYTRNPETHELTRTGGTMSREEAEAAEQAAPAAESVEPSTPPQE
jgi:hypothetical protein